MDDDSHPSERAPGTVPGQNAHEGGIAPPSATSGEHSVTAGDTSPASDSEPEIVIVQDDTVPANAALTDGEKHDDDDEFFRIVTSGGDGRMDATRWQNTLQALGIETTVGRGPATTEQTVNVAIIDLARPSPVPDVVKPVVAQSIVVPGPIPDPIPGTRPLGTPSTPPAPKPGRVADDRGSASGSSPLPEPSAPRPVKGHTEKDPHGDAPTFPPPAVAALSVKPPAAPPELEGATAKKADAPSDHDAPCNVVVVHIAPRRRAYAKACQY